MFTTYFHEKCSIARRRLQSARSVDAVVSAWSEVSHAWLSEAQLQKPAELVEEYEDLDRIMTARSDLGPFFGGSDCGVWAMSLNILPRDELEAIWIRMLTFTRECVVWSDRARRRK